jgi:hypothetical protein
LETLPQPITPVRMRFFGASALLLVKTPDATVAPASRVFLVNSRLFKRCDDAFIGD